MVSSLNQETKWLTSFIAGIILQVVKTSKDQFNSLASYIEQNHPYDVPEVIATEVNYDSYN